MNEKRSAQQFLPAWIRLMRPTQWTKNGLVAAACFFAIWDPGQGLTPQHAIITTIIAVAIFCITSSGIYVVNDMRDIEEDRKHPVKRSRPLAAGEVSMRTSGLLAAGLLLLGLGTSFLLTPGFAACVVAYVAIQFAYTGFLKKIALLDIFIIATGFVLRAIAGGAALKAEISPWLLLCTFLLALFLALCKRRHERTSLDKDAAEHRAVLVHYNPQLLDQLISIVSASTIVSYAMYTLADSTCKKFGTHALGFTIPFVIFGIFRYLDLVHHHDEGGRPERVLLTDVPILITVFLFGVTASVIFILH